MSRLIRETVPIYRHGKLVRTEQALIRFKALRPSRSSRLTEQEAAAISAATRSAAVGVRLFMHVRDDCMRSECWEQENPREARLAATMRYIRSYELARHHCRAVIELGGEVYP